MRYLVFARPYKKEMKVRAHSILHINQAVKRRVFVRSKCGIEESVTGSFSLSRQSILLGNGMAYLPDVTIKHDSMGVVLHARKLRKNFGFYDLDPFAPPVIIHMLMKVAVSSALHSSR